MICPVKVLQPLEIQGHTIAPGSRLLASRAPAGWLVLWHGAEIPVPADALAPVETKTTTVEQRQSARDEEYNEVKP